MSHNSQSREIKCIIFESFAITLETMALYDKSLNRGRVYQCLDTWHDKEASRIGAIEPNQATNMICYV
jgi:hypothetical protein